MDEYTQLKIAEQYRQESEEIARRHHAALQVRKSAEETKRKKPHLARQLLVILMNRMQ